MLGYRLPSPRRQKDEGEKPFWISYADLMTAMMVLFLVIMSVSLLVVLAKLSDTDAVPRAWFEREADQHEQSFNQLWETDNEREKLADVVELQALSLVQRDAENHRLAQERQRLEDDNRQLALRINRQTVLTEQRAQRMVDVLARLQNEAKNIKSCNITVEQKKDTLTVMFSSTDPLRVAMFDSNSHQLHDKDQKCIREFVPSIYHQVAQDDWFKLVGVEGFTDTNGTYLHNLGLSLKRAQSVVCAVMSADKRAQFLPDEFLSFVQERFLVGGFSFNSAKANKQESRRVELRLDFKTVEEYDSPAVSGEMMKREFDRNNLGMCVFTPPIPSPLPTASLPDVPVSVPVKNDAKSNAKIDHKVDHKVDHKTDEKAGAKRDANTDKEKEKKEKATPPTETKK